MVSYEHLEFAMLQWDLRLNPYCSGQWFRTLHKVSAWHCQEVNVLILIVVDNGFVLITNSGVITNAYGVLILIVVDNGFVLDLTRHY